jgi:hypothetical protein
MERKFKPLIKGAITSMVLGIVSISLCWLFYIPFFGILHSIATLVLGIYAVSLATRVNQTFEAEPEVWSRVSLGLAKAGRITGILGIIFSALSIVGAIVISAFILTAGRW